MQEQEDPLAGANFDIDELFQEMEAQSTRPSTAASSTGSTSTTSRGRMSGASGRRRKLEAAISDGRAGGGDGMGGQHSFQGTIPPSSPVAPPPTYPAVKVQVAVPLTDWLAQHAKRQKNTGFPEMTPALAQALAQPVPVPSSLQPMEVASMELQARDALWRAQLQHQATIQQLQQHQNQQSGSMERPASPPPARPPAAEPTRPVAYAQYAQGGSSGGVPNLSPFSQGAQGAGASAKPASASAMQPVLSQFENPSACLANIRAVGITSSGQTEGASCDGSLRTTPVQQQQLLVLQPQSQQQQSQQMVMGSTSHFDPAQFFSSQQQQPPVPPPSDCDVPSSASGATPRSHTATLDGSVVNPHAPPTSIPSSQPLASLQPGSVALCQCPGSRGCGVLDADGWTCTDDTSTADYSSVSRPNSTAVSSSITSSRPSFSGLGSSSYPPSEGGFSSSSQNARAIPVDHSGFSTSFQFPGMATPPVLRMPADGGGAAEVSAGGVGGPDAAGAVPGVLPGTAGCHALANTYTQVAASLQQQLRDNAGLSDAQRALLQQHLEAATKMQRDLSGMTAARQQPTQPAQPAQPARGEAVTALCGHVLDEPMTIDGGGGSRGSRGGAAARAATQQQQHNLSGLSTINTLIRGSPAEAISSVGPSPELSSLRPHRSSATSSSSFSSSFGSSSSSNGGISSGGGVFAMSRLQRRPMMRPPPFGKAHTMVNMTPPPTPPQIYDRRVRGPQGRVLNRRYTDSLLTSNDDRIDRLRFGLRRMFREHLPSVGEGSCSSSSRSNASSIGVRGNSQQAGAQQPSSKESSREPSQRSSFLSRFPAPPSLRSARVGPASMSNGSGGSGRSGGGSTRSPMVVSRRIDVQPAQAPAP